MKPIFVAAAALLGLALAVPALAADRTPPRPVAAAPAPAPAAPYDWSGIYAGAVAGYAWGDTRTRDNTLISDRFDVDGGFGGATLGFNAKLGGSLVGGVETDLSWAGVSGSNTTAPLCDVAPGCKTDVNYLGTVRLRGGWAFDNVLPYATVGLAYAQLTGEAFGPHSATNWRGAWTGGVGLEWGILPQLSVKAEYLYVGKINSLDLGGGACSAGVCRVDDVQLSTVRGGINWHFR